MSEMASNFSFETTFTPTSDCVGLRSREEQNSPASSPGTLGHEKKDESAEMIFGTKPETQISVFEQEPIDYTQPDTGPGKCLEYPFVFIEDFPRQGTIGSGFSLPELRDRFVTPKIQEDEEYHDALQRIIREHNATRPMNEAGDALLSLVDNMGTNPPKSNDELAGRLLQWQAGFVKWLKNTAQIGNMDMFTDIVSVGMNAAIAFGSNQRWIKGVAISGAILQMCSLIWKIIERYRVQIKIWKTFEEYSQWAMTFTNIFQVATAEEKTSTNLPWDVSKLLLITIHTTVTLLAPNAIKYSVDQVVKSSAAINGIEGIVKSVAQTCGIDFDGDGEIRQTLKSLSAEGNRITKVLKLSRVQAQRAEGWIRRVRDVTSACSAMKHSQQFTALLQAIATIQAKVVEKINAEKVGRETQHGRPVPAGLFVEGGPGRGKSTMLEQMFQEVAADLKVPDDRRSIFHMESGGNHWNAYQGNAFGVFEDIGAQGKGQAANPKIALLLSVLSPVYTNLAGAAIENKESPAQFLAVGCTSNVPFAELDVGLTMQGRNALMSRFMSIYVDDMLWDRNKTRDNQTHRRPDFSHLSMWIYEPTGNADAPLLSAYFPGRDIENFTDEAGQQREGISVTYEDVKAWLKQQIKTNQDNFVNKTGNMQAYEPNHEISIDYQNWLGPREEEDIIDDTEFTGVKESLIDWATYGRENVIQPLVDSTVSCYKAATYQWSEYWRPGNQEAPPDNKAVMLVSGVPNTGKTFGFAAALNFTHRGRWGYVSSEEYRNARTDHNHEILVIDDLLDPRTIEGQQTYMNWFNAQPPFVLVIVITNYPTPFKYYSETQGFGRRSAAGETGRSTILKFTTGTTREQIIEEMTRMQYGILHGPVKPVEGIAGPRLHPDEYDIWLDLDVAQGETVTSDQVINAIRLSPELLWRKMTILSYFTAVAEAGTPEGKALAGLRVCQSIKEKHPGKSFWIRILNFVADYNGRDLIAGTKHTVEFNMEERSFTMGSKTFRVTPEIYKAVELDSSTGLSLGDLEAAQYLNAIRDHEQKQYDELGILILGDDPEIAKEIRAKIRRRRMIWLIDAIRSYSKYALYGLGCGFTVYLVWKMTSGNNTPSGEAPLQVIEIPEVQHPIISMTDEVYPTGARTHNKVAVSKQRPRMQKQMIRNRKKVLMHLWMYDNELEPMMKGDHNAYANIHGEQFWNDLSPQQQERFNYLDRAFNATPEEAARVKYTGIKPVPSENIAYEQTVMNQSTFNKIARNIGRVEGEEIGTGFMLTQQTGVTACHLLNPMDKFFVFKHNGVIHKVECFWRDPAADIAMFRTAKPIEKVSDLRQYLVDYRILQTVQKGCPLLFQQDGQFIPSEFSIYIANPDSQAFPTVFYNSAQFGHPQGKAYSNLIEMKPGTSGGPWIGYMRNNGVLQVVILGVQSAKMTVGQSAIFALLCIETWNAAFKQLSPRITTGVPKIVENVQNRSYDKTWEEIQIRGATRWMNPALKEKIFIGDTTGLDVPLRLEGGSMNYVGAVQQCDVPPRRRITKFKEKPFWELFHNIYPIEARPPSDNIELDYPDTAVYDSQGNFHPLGARLLPANAMRPDSRRVDAIRGLPQKLARHHWIISGRRSLRPVSLRQAINGVKGVGKTTLGTGAGVTAYMWGGITDKEGLFERKDNDELEFRSPEFKQIVEDTIKLAKAGKVPLAISQVRKKDECTKKQYKPRAYFSTDLISVILEKKVLIPLQQMLLDFQLETGPLIVGVDPILHFHQIFNKCALESNFCKCFDISGFDLSVCIELMRAFWEYVYEMYRLGGASIETLNMINVLSEMHSVSHVLFENMLVEQLGGMKSGMFGTNIGDSIIVDMIFIEAMMFSTGWDFEKTTKEIRLGTGDDKNLVPTAEFMRAVPNPQTITERIQDLWQINVTPASSKSSKVTDTWDNIKDLEFCSRTFVKVDSVWMSKLKLDSIFKSMKWTGHREKTIWLEELRHARLELISWGEELYTQFETACQKWCKLMELPWVSEDYELAKNKIVKQIIAADHGNLSSDLMRSEDYRNQQKVISEVYESKEFLELVPEVIQAMEFIDNPNNRQAIRKCLTGNSEDRWENGMWNSLVQKEWRSMFKHHIQLCKQPHKPIINGLIQVPILQATSFAWLAWAIQEIRGSGIPTTLLTRIASDELGSLIKQHGWEAMLKNHPRVTRALCALKMDWPQMALLLVNEKDNILMNTGQHLVYLKEEIRLMRLSPLWENLPQEECQQDSTQLVSNSDNTNSGTTSGGQDMPTNSQDRPTSLPIPPRPLPRSSLGQTPTSTIENTSTTDRRHLKLDQAEWTVRMQRALQENNHWEMLKLSQAMTLSSLNSDKQQTGAGDVTQQPEHIPTLPSTHDTAVPSEPENVGTTVQGPGFVQMAGIPGFSPMGLIGGQEHRNVFELAYREVKCQTITLSTDTAANTILARFDSNPWKSSAVSKPMATVRDLHTSTNGGIVLTLLFPKLPTVSGIITLTLIPAGVGRLEQNQLTPDYLSQFSQTMVDVQKGGQYTVELFPGIAPEKQGFYMSELVYNQNDSPFTGEIVMMTMIPIQNMYGTTLTGQVTVFSHWHKDCMWVVPKQLAAGKFSVAQPQPPGNEVPSIPFELIATMVTDGKEGLSGWESWINAGLPIDDWKGEEAIDEETQKRVLRISKPAAIVNTRIDGATTTAGIGIGLIPKFSKSGKRYNNAHLAQTGGVYYTTHEEDDCMNIICEMKVFWPTDTDDLRPIAEFGLRIEDGQNPNNYRVGYVEDQVNTPLDNNTIYANCKYYILPNVKVISEILPHTVQFFKVGERRLPMNFNSNIIVGPNSKVITWPKTEESCSNARAGGMKVDIGTIPTVTSSGIRGTPLGTDTRVELIAEDDFIFAIQGNQTKPCQPVSFASDVFQKSLYDAVGQRFVVWEISYEGNYVLELGWQVKKGFHINTTDANRYAILTGVAWDQIVAKVLTVTELKPSLRPASANFTWTDRRTSGALRLRKTEEGFPIIESVRINGENLPIQTTSGRRYRNPRPEPTMMAAGIAAGGQLGGSAMQGAFNLASLPLQAKYQRQLQQMIGGQQLAQMTLAGKINSNLMNQQSMHDRDQMLMSHGVANKALQRA